MKFAVVLLLCAAAVSAEMPAINRFMRPTGAERFTNLLKAVENSRIAGGTEVKPHSRPYQVGIVLTLADYVSFCGGSLISRNYVMTAAHCVNDGRNIVKDFTVVLGTDNIYDEDNSVMIQSFTAIVHPDWNPVTLQNDIALIKLPISVELTDNIQLVKIPPLSALGNKFTGYAGTVSGWGRPNDGIPILSPELREVTVDIITNLECNVKYLDIIQATQICTSGANGKNICSGDDGGPLTVVLDGDTIQVGIVSFGAALGCETGWPAVYTRVTKFVDWIHATAGIN